MNRSFFMMFNLLNCSRLLIVSYGSILIILARLPNNNEFNVSPASSLEGEMLTTKETNDVPDKVGSKIRVNLQSLQGT